MPRIEENEETLIETKVERRCNLSNRCKFCLCFTVSTIIIIGIGIADIYYAESYDGSDFSI